MPGTKKKQAPVKKMRGGAMMAKPKAAPVKKMRGGGMAAKPKAAPMKKGGGVTKSRVRSSSKKAL
tara:strand:- start:14 stop:208 length:195 start_codon:yes stop_codon:yes gene_type:complete